MENKNNYKALVPIGIFILFYLGLGCIFEYGLKIELGFYKIPVVVIFLIALTVACLQNRALSFDEKLTLMGKGIGEKDITTMILIFLAAGAFVGVVGRSSAESVAYFVLSLIPTRFAVVMLFIVACFISLSMGTSVGTISLITPIAVAIGKASGFDIPLCIGSIVGGAMFGDNLSFISDTTIAACNGQGCDMRAKFRENFAIAVPAAIATLICLYLYSMHYDISGYIQHDYNLIQIIPYLLVLLGGIIGLNVFVILLVGIVVGSLTVGAGIIGCSHAYCRILVVSHHHGHSCGHTTCNSTTAIQVRTFIIVRRALIEHNTSQDRSDSICCSRRS